MATTKISVEHRHQAIDIVTTPNLFEHIKHYIDNLNLHPLEFVFRYRDAQLQVGENYSHLSNFRPKFSKS